MKKWTDEEVAYLKQNYCKKLNPELSLIMGRTAVSIRGMAQRLGLLKTIEQRLECQRIATAEAKKSNTGYCSEKKRLQILEASRGTRFKKGHKCSLNKEQTEKRIKTLKETIRKERRRAMFGLPQKTRLKVFKQPKVRSWLLYKLRKRGYIVSDDKKTVYYNKETRRITILEAHIQEKFGVKLYEA